MVLKPTTQKVQETLEQISEAQLIVVVHAPDLDAVGHILQRSFLIPKNLKLGYPKSKKYNEIIYIYFFIII